MSLTQSLTDSHVSHGQALLVSVVEDALLEPHLLSVEVGAGGPIKPGAEDGDHLAVRDGAVLVDVEKIVEDVDDLVRWEKGFADYSKDDVKKS